MAIKINKATLHQLFFSICVIIPFFNNYEISFLLWLIAVFFTIKKKYTSLFFNYLMCFVGILAIAVVVGLFFRYPIYFMIRDITYLLKPILGLLLGYQLFKNKIKEPFLFLLKVGLFSALVHLALVTYGIVFEGARSVADIRLYGGHFNDFEVYTLILLLFHKKLNITITKKQFRWYLGILGLSGFFYLSRTNFIQFVILFFALKGWLVLNKQSITIIGSVFLFSVVAFSSISFYNPKRDGGAIDEFLYKVKLIPQEAFATKIDRSNWKDFHDHYRSYENIRTIEQITHNKTFLLGEGIGSRVDLKQEVFLGGSKLRYISILHNGFMTILLKSGIVGVVLLIVSIGFFFKKFSIASTEDKYINFLFVGTGIFLLLSYWVFLGFYNLLDTKTIFIGFLLAYKNKLNTITANY